MLYAIFIILHILVSGLLITVVMMQSGRGGGGLAGAFGGGGGGNQTLFGGRGATTFLTKTTWVLGGAFMVTSLVLALAIGRRGSTAEEPSLLRENPIELPASSAPLNPIEGTQQPADPLAAPGEPAGQQSGGN